VTVRDWITGHAIGVPAELTIKVLALLRADADRDAGQTAESCMAAATRSLDELLDSGRHGRDTALDLLAIDALTTYAFEHACESGKPDAVRALASDSARAVSKLSLARG
jgi:hypothetical protein